MSLTNPTQIDGPNLLTGDPVLSLNTEDVLGSNPENGYLYLFNLDGHKVLAGVKVLPVPNVEVYRLRPQCHPSHIVQTIHTDEEEDLVGAHKTLYRRVVDRIVSLIR